MTGKFYGIGVGPGNPELITVMAFRILQETDIVCVPKSYAGRDSLALSVVKSFLKEDVETLELSFPMSKDRKVLEESWEAAGELVAARVKEGKKVSFVTIGDPLFYSTYGYLLAHLRNNHPALPVETVPGITAMAACSALLQQPLAEGDETLAVVPAAYGLEKLKDILDNFDNVVLMKVHRRLPEVVKLLKDMGLADNAVLYNRCGYQDGFYVTDLDELDGVTVDYMSLLIVRKRG
jgi:precorrin-2/cobalt-factor-2 C20-methyltransferase